MKKKRNSKKETEEREKVVFPIQSADLPATQKMLQLVRTELKSEMRAGFRQVDARFIEVDSRFTELKGEMDKRFAQVNGEMDKRFAQVDSRFAQVDARLDSLDNQMNMGFAQVGVFFKKLEAKMDTQIQLMQSRFDTVAADVARIGILVEEQRSDNRVVLEELAGLRQRQDRLEAKGNEFLRG